MKKEDKIKLKEKKDREKALAKKEKALNKAMREYDSVEIRVERLALTLFLSFRTKKASCTNTCRPVASYTRFSFRSIESYPGRQVW